MPRARVRPISTTSFTTGRIYIIDSPFDGNANLTFMGLSNLILLSRIVHEVSAMGEAIFQMSDTLDALTGHDCLLSAFFETGRASQNALTVIPAQFVKCTRRTINGTISFDSINCYRIIVCFGSSSIPI